MKGKIDAAQSLKNISDKKERLTKRYDNHQKNGSHVTVLESVVDFYLEAKELNAFKELNALNHEIEITKPRMTIKLRELFGSMSN